jgi:hypothetical protein
MAMEYGIACGIASAGNSEELLVHMSKIALGACFC